MRITNLLLLSIAAMPAIAAAVTQTFKPSEEVNMNEAPPPWAARPEVTATRQPVAQPPAEAARNATSGNSIENWYSNRRKAASQAGNRPESLQAAAEQNDAGAQYKLAMLLRNPDNPRANIQQSLEWQRKAAEAGNAEAQYGLGLLYANGQYVPQDPAMARYWFQQAADRKYVAARLALISLKLDAPAQAVAATAPRVEPMPAPAAQTPVAAASPELMPQVPSETAAGNAGRVGNPGNKGSSSADHGLENIEPAVVRQSAEAGDKQAQLLLGTMYEEGIGGLPSDLREAAYWYEQAARQGYPKAQYNLGLLYEDGRGVNQDYNRAAYWYDKAAKSGFAEAQNNLGVLLILGKGVKKDPKQAEKLFNEAAAKGNANARRNLSMLKNG